jgi:hypothetical protein
MEKTRITISVGGLALGFDLDNQRFVSRLVSHYKGYCRTGTGGRNDCFFNCSLSKRRLASCQRVRYSISPDGVRHAERYDFRCVWKDRNGELTFWPSLYSFDACVRVVLASCIMRKNGLLLHSSAVVRGNSAFVFSGPSGSGKTTIARLSKARKILNDEIVALRIDHGKKVFVQGTPFWGQMGTGPFSKKSYPVRNIFFLKKSLVLSALPVVPAVAVRKLLRCVCLFSRDPDELLTALETCIRIVSLTDCRELRFPKQQLDWKKLVSSGKK